MLSLRGVAVRSRTKHGLKFASISRLKSERAWWLSSTMTRGLSWLMIWNRAVSSAFSMGLSGLPSAFANAARLLFS